MKPFQSKIDEFHERGYLFPPDVLGGERIAGLLDREREAHA